MSKPNIIICMCDELRAFEIACYGHPHIRTPNMDRLAEQGTRFEVAASNNPVCMPARSIVLSGQYSSTCNGSQGNACWITHEGKWIMPHYPEDGRPHLKDKTLPECLKDAGYHTAAIGKWHVHSWPDDIGFDHYIIPRHHHANRAQLFTEDGGEEFCAPGWAVDYELSRVCSYISEKVSTNQPFFLYYNISPPHMPVAEAPDYYLNMYDRSETVTRDNVDPDNIPGWEDTCKTYLWDYRHYREHLPYTRELPDGMDYEKLLAYYMGNTTWVDDTLGELLSHLDQQGIADNTIIIFTADHGDNFGSHGLMGKGGLTDESIRIPYIVRGPGVTQQVNTEHVASLVDLAPTFLSMIGEDIPDHVQGRDLSAILSGDIAHLDESGAYIETSGNDFGIRTPTHLIGVSGKDGGKELRDDVKFYHDCVADPYQLNNQNEALDDTGTDLEQRLRRSFSQYSWK